MLGVDDGDSHPLHEGREQQEGPAVRGLKIIKEQRTGDNRAPPGSDNTTQHPCPHVGGQRTHNGLAPGLPVNGRGGEQEGGGESLIHALLGANNKGLWG